MALAKHSAILALLCELPFYLEIWNTKVIKYHEEQKDILLLLHGSSCPLCSQTLTSLDHLL
jgi:hypothetical protein